MKPAAKPQPRDRTTTAAPPPSPLDAAPPYLAAGIAAALVLGLYALTLAPSTAWWDTSEYIATAHVLGIPHPPGNPLFVVMARAWDLLLSPTGLPVAVRINLFSATMSAGAAFFWYLVVWRVLVAFTPSEGVRRIGAGASVLLSATAFTVWNQSNVNEKVYTVSLFTIAGLSWLAFLWRDHAEARAVGPRRRRHGDNAIVLMVFVLALSVGNHLMAFLAAPALVLFLARVRPRVFADWKLYACGAAFGLLGLSVHLYLPLRAGRGPVIDEASPTCASVPSALASIVTMGGAGCPNLSQALARKQYDKPSMLLDPTLYPRKRAPRGLRLMGAQVLNWLQYFDWQWSRSLQGDVGYFAPARMPFTLVFLALGIHGAAEHRRRERKSFAYLAALFAMVSAGLAFYLNFKYGYTQVRVLGMADALSEVRERDYFFLVSFSLWGLWCGMGLTALWLRLAGPAAGRRKLVRAAPVLLPALVPLALNGPYASRAGDYAARDWAYNLLQSVEPYGVVVTGGDNDTFPLWYVQEVEGVRKDVTVMVTSYLNTDWYVRQLRDVTRPCPTPGAAAADRTTIVCQRPFVPGGPTPFHAARAPSRPVFALTDGEIRANVEEGYGVVDGDAVFRAEGVEAMVRGGTRLDPADRFLLRMVAGTRGDRPVYFASTTGAGRRLGLGPYLARQGMAFRLTTPAEARAAGMVPMPGGADASPVLGAWVDAARTRALLRAGFSWHGLLGRAHWSDDATRNMPVHYAYAWHALAQAERVRGDTAAARAALRSEAAWRDLAKR
ncbi:MAG: hypothetical protein JWM27_2951 [Gemmatimonadetes bacterium]|nr:hypothetical protein [Gemmatimonadota bacterium]